MLLSPRVAPRYSFPLLNCALSVDAETIMMMAASSVDMRFIVIPV
jgi:hypothetical protein